MFTITRIMRDWVLTRNLENRRACDRQWRQRNPDKIRDYCRRYRAKHPEKVREVQRRYRQSHLEKFHAWDAKYWANRTDAQKLRDKELHRRNYWKNHTPRIARGRKSSRSSEHGITDDQFEMMRQQQKSRCAICNVPFDEKRYRCCVDHNHETNIIRGLLCGPCNHLLGQARENSIILQAAMQYLQNPPFTIPSTRGIGRAGFSSKVGIRAFIRRTFI